MSKNQLPTLPTYEFEFSGGRLCLDFVNTMSARATDQPKERLKSYADLVSWGRQAQILSESETWLLLAEDLQRPADTALVLQQTIVLREALYRLFLAHINHALVAESDLAIFNTALGQALTYAALELVDGHFVWGWTVQEGRLDRMCWDVLRSAADVLTSEEVRAVKTCAQDTCNWLFLDTTKNHSRRWCEMKTCGNQVKARRHYKLSRQNSAVAKGSETSEA